MSAYGSANISPRAEWVMRVSGVVVVVRHGEQSLDGGLMHGAG